GVLSGDLVVTYPVSQICALRGSSVLIPCTYDYPEGANVTERKWSKDIGSDWDAPPYIYQSKAESLKPDYTGRVEYTEQNKSCSFTLVDIRNTDSGSYYFRIKINQKPNASSGVPGVSLLVSDAPKDTKVSVSPSGEIVEGSSVTLTCSSNANPPVENYTWFKTNGAAVWEKGSGQSFNITEVSSGDSGQYYCEAQNKHGAQNSSAVPLPVTGMIHLIPIHRNKKEL
ncbi:CD22 protein, partial [Amia calva]|nr:CD22 protein [Amia calva]